MKGQVASLWVLKFNPRQFTPLVKKGDRVKEGQVLGTRRRRHALLLDLARRLGVKGKKVEKYLLVEKGIVVKEGDLLARRQVWLRPDRVVKAPRGGRFVWPIQRPGWGKITWITKKVIRSPLPGKVISRQENSLGIRFMAQIFKGRVNFRCQLWGKIAAAPSDFLQLAQLEKNACLLVKTPTLPLAHKAKVLGATAIISQQPLKNSPLPNFVSDDYNALLPFVGHPVLLDGRQRRLLVCR